MSINSPNILGSDTAWIGIYESGGFSSNCNNPNQCDGDFSWIDGTTFRDEKWITLKFNIDRVPISRLLSDRVFNVLLFFREKIVPKS